MLYEGLVEEFSSDEAGGQGGAGTAGGVVFNGQPGELSALGYNERWLN